MSSVAHCLEEALESVSTPMQEQVRNGVEKAFMQPLRHKFELEADALSLQILADSGIDPTAAITAMQKLVDLEQKQVNESPPPDQMKHPPASDRLAMLKKTLPAAVLAYQINYAKTE
jgi:predicted Zn-dependent protease